LPSPSPLDVERLLSFSRYVAERKAAAAARQREGAAYAYAGDLKVRRTLEKIRPVTLAVEATVRLWQTVEKSRMLGTAVKVTPKQFPQLYALAERCATTLQIPVPTMYVAPNIGSLNAHTFGTQDDACIVLNAALVDNLSSEELLDVIGHECGHIQNDHAVYMTTLYFLTQAGSQFLRWAAKPATLALKGWARRAEITCDRAGVICTRSLDASVSTLVKLALGSRTLWKDIDLDEYLRQMEESRGPGRLDELGQSHPYLPKRVAALRAFAETAYFRSLIKPSPKESAATAARENAARAGANEGDGAGGSVAPEGVSADGISIEACDARVAELLKVWG